MQLIMGNSIENKEINPEIVEYMQESYKELISLIGDTSDKQFLASFFECLFTPSERKAMVERWILVKELKKGVTQREIARKFNMSLCKITRGSRELQKKDSAFLKALSIVSQD